MGQKSGPLKRYLAAKESKQKSGRACFLRRDDPLVTLTSKIRKIVNIFECARPLRPGRRATSESPACCSRLGSARPRIDKRHWTATCVCVRARLLHPNMFAQRRRNRRRYKVEPSCCRVRRAKKRQLPAEAANAGAHLPLAGRPRRLKIIALVKCVSRRSRQWWCLIGAVRPEQCSRWCAP